jgi:hypothetical protein
VSADIVSDYFETCREASLVLQRKGSIREVVAPRRAAKRRLFPKELVLTGEARRRKELNP